MLLTSKHNIATTLQIMYLLSYVVWQVFSMGPSSLYVQTFLGVHALTKISAGAHGLAAGVVANVSPWGNLREVVRLNIC